VNSLDSTRRIRDESITLHQIFKIASTYDTICSEWVNNYPVTFDLAYPYLAEQTRKTKDTSQAVIEAFLKVLAEHPDTFIARKTSLARAKEVSSKAEHILELGSLETPLGKKASRSLTENSDRKATF